MILGTGCDLVEIERMKKACEKEAFLVRSFTEEERRQAEGKVPRLAGDFAVKEAVAKALGTGFSDFWLTDIEVLRDGRGKPYVNLYGNAKKRFEAMGMERLEVSISNTREHAVAFAVGEGEKP